MNKPTRKERLAEIASRLTVRDALLEREETAINNKFDKAKPRKKNGKPEEFWTWRKRTIANRDASLKPIQDRRRVIQSRRDKIRAARDRVMFAGQPTTIEEIKGTASMLRYYRAFLDSDPSVYVECKDLQSGWIGGRLDRTTAARRLGWVVNVAINRKAGIPDTKWDSDFYQEACLVNYIMDRIRGVHQSKHATSLQFWYPNKRKFESRQLQRRYGRLLDEFTAYRNEMLSD